MGDKYYVPGTPKLRSPAGIPSSDSYWPPGRVSDRDSTDFARKGRGFSANATLAGEIKPEEQP